MLNLGRIVTYIILLWVFVYTISYGTWTWKRKNKLGAIMVYILGFAAIALPLYALILRE